MREMEVAPTKTWLQKAGIHDVGSAVDAPGF